MIGRVCGTAIGTAPMPTTRRHAEALDDLADGPREGLPAGVGLGPVQQQVRRAAGVVAAGGRRAAARRSPRSGRGRRTSPAGGRGSRGTRRRRRSPRPARRTGREVPARRAPRRCRRRGSRRGRAPGSAAVSTPSSSGTSSTMWTSRCEHASFSLVTGQSRSIGTNASTGGARPSRPRGPEACSRALVSASIACHGLPDLAGGRPWPCPGRPRCRARQPAWRCGAGRRRAASAPRARRARSLRSGCRNRRARRRGRSRGSTSCLGDVPLDLMWGGWGAEVRRVDVGPR